MASTKTRAPRRTVVAAAAHMAAGKLTGAAFGEIMVKEIEQKAEQEIKAQISLKDRLRTLMGLDPKGHDEFRATLAKRREQINDAAKAAGQSLAEYRAHNAVSNSVYVMLSMWSNLSLACAAGYAPDFDLPWSTITQNATAYKNASGKPSPELQKLEEEKKRIAEDKDMAPQAKAQALVELDAKVQKQLSVDAKKPDHTTKVGRPSQGLIDKVYALIKDQPISEVEKLRDYLITFCDNVKANAKSARVKTPNQMAAASPTFKAPAKTTEKAEAKGEKRTARKAKRK